MFLESTPHGMRQVTDDEILSAADAIRVRRESGNGVPTLRLCDLPSQTHTTTSLHNHNFGGCCHVHCITCYRYRCSR